MSAQLLYARSGNEAVEINPSTGATIALVTSGSDWYWTVFSVMAATTLGYVVLMAFVPRRERFFHYLSVGAALFSSIAYFTMASNLGWAAVETEFGHQQGGGERQVFYARYIGWFMSAPLIMLNLSFFAGVDWVTALFTAMAVNVYIIGGLVGAVVSTTYKWGYWTIGVAAWCLVVYQLVWVSMRSLNELTSVTVEPKIRTWYRLIIGGVVFIYSLYPICWGLSEGGNVITPTSEGVFYGVLDLIALPILNTAVLLASRKLDIEELGLGIPAARTESVPEKTPVA
ncbi:uncharacterized protein V1518DRAFT_420551 [Limtongia smithiae]|uniref:uncharacterized protein n=1 Tax=Limtongia smithiae TaxID=1125753 RepID=UPI0034CD0E0F